MKKSLLFILSTLLLFVDSFSQTQLRSTYPVQVSVQLNTSSVYLSDYSDSWQEPMRVSIVCLDPTVGNIQVKLRIKVKGTSFSMQTKDYAVFQPLNISGGLPYTLTQEELSPYFKAENLNISGLINGRMPEGFTEFAVEVLEYRTGVIISTRGFGFANLSLQPPPILVQPLSKDNINISGSNNILFTWNPRHNMSSIGEVYYTFTIKELHDDKVDINTAYNYSPIIYSEQTSLTSLVYGVDKPILEPNKQYLWSVRASQQGDANDQSKYFQNNGQSEIRSFKIIEDCKAPVSVNATTNRDRLIVSWVGQDNHVNYNLRIRKQGTDTWIEQQTSSSQYEFQNIAKGKDYEYQVGGFCQNMTNAVYSSSQTIRIPLVDSTRQVLCGKDPQIKITNRQPKESLSVGEIIHAADFPIKVLSCSGGNGTFSGTGAVTIPYISSIIGVAVVFNNIQLNTDGQLIGGYIETTYDNSKSSIGNLDNLYQGGTKYQEKGIMSPDISLDFVLPTEPCPTIRYDSASNKISFYNDLGDCIYSAELKNKNGSEVFPMTVKDKKDNVFEVDEETNDEGIPTGKYKFKSLGKQTSPLKSSQYNDKGIDSNFAIVKFKTKDSNYSFDEYQEYYGTVAAIKYINSSTQSERYLQLSKDYYTPWHFVQEGKTLNLEAQVKIVDRSIDPTKIIFKTSSGLVVDAQYNKKSSTFALSVPASTADTYQELHALYPDVSDSYKHFGQINIDTRAGISGKLVLVNLGGSYDAKQLESEINAITNSIGLQWIVTEETGFRYDDTDLINKLFDKNSGLLVSYNDAQKQLNAALKAYLGSKYDNSACYLFMLDKSDAGNSRNVLGFMPRGRQFGYIYCGNLKNNLSSTVVHELMHGRFLLRHTFDDSYGTSVKEGIDPNNLMDYRNGTHIAKWQWDQVYDPAVFAGVFKEDEDGEKIIDRYKFTYNVTEQLGEAERTNEKFVVDNQGAINLFSKALTQGINSQLKSVNDNGQPVYVIVDLFTYTNEVVDIDQVKSDVDKQVQALEEANKDIVIIVAVGYKLVNENNVPLQEEPDLLIRAEFSKNIEGAASFKEWQVINQIDEEKVRSFVDDLIAVLPYNSIFDSENCLELSYEELGISSASELNPNDVKEWVSAFAGDNGVSIDYSYTGYPIVNNPERPTALFSQPENSNADINIAVHFDDDGKKIIICHHYKAGAIVIPSVTDSGEPVQETTVDEIVGLSKIYAGKALDYAKSGGGKIQALFNSAVKGVVAAKTWTKTICDKMEVPEQTWNQSSGKFEAYKRSPVNIEPLMAGVGDGTFEELKSIPELITLALDVAFDKEVRASLWQSLTSLSWEDIKNMPVQMVKDKLGVYTNSHESVVKHEAGKDGVAIASMFFGFGSAKKAKELAETVGKNSTDYAKALQKAYDKIDVSKIDEFGVKLDNLGGGVTGVKLKKIGNTNHTTIAKIDVDGNLSFTESEHVFEAVYEIEKKGGTKGYCVLDKADEGKTIFREISEDVAKISHLLKTEPNKAFFWSGNTNGIGGWEKALEVAKSKGGITLEGLLKKKGVDLPEWDLNNPATEKLWEDVSTQYSKQVSGEVRAVVGKTLRDGNIWETIELKRLKANPKVTKITTIDPETLVETIIFTR